MGLLDRFMSNNSQQQQTPASQPANTNPSAANPASQQPTGNPPNNVQNTQGTNTQQNPLDLYNQMMDNATKGQQDTPPSFNLPEDGLNKVASSMKFTSNMPKELMEKAMSGDPAAFLEAMDHVGREAYRHSIQHGSALTDKFVSQRSEYDLKGINSKVKSELTSQELSSTEGFSHPLVRKELTRVADALSKANPDASPQEIAEAAKDYIKQTYAAINPSSANQQSTPQKASEVDWDNWFSDTKSTE